MITKTGERVRVLSGYLNNARQGHWSSILFIILFLLPFLAFTQQNKPVYNLGPQILPMYDPMTGNLNTSCPNSNFEQGDFTNWTGCYGWYNKSCNCNTAGLRTTGSHPLHKIIPAPGWHDHNTCDSLLNVFPGEDYVARLGDTMYTSSANAQSNRCPPPNPQPVKKEAELKYAIDVSSSSYLFIYRYAVVLQTGGHTPPSSYQPDFRIQITDASGNVLDSTCGYYYVTAQLSGAPVSGWHRCQNNSNGDVYWKDWTTVGVNLSAYVGKTVYANFKDSGCSYDNNLGYAYI